MDALPWFLILSVIAIPGYFIPFVIAFCRNHNINGVFLVNFFAGWTLIGWIIALAMACGESRAQQVVYLKETKMPAKQTSDKGESEHE